jgi:hypothetical protein
MIPLLGFIALLGIIVGLGVCALFLRAGLEQGDWAFVVGALLTSGVFLYAVFWLRDAPL